MRNQLLLPPSVLADRLGCNLAGRITYCQKTAPLSIVMPESTVQALQSIPIE
eukprot:SAG31_NODE_43291_length_267_cov_1.851190_1_plen_51_part_01